MFLSLRHKLFQTKILFFMMTKYFYRFATLLAFSIVVASCGKEDERQELVVPTTYNSPNFMTNASVQIAIGNQLKSITDEAKKGRVTGITVSKNTLQGLFAEGNPSLKNAAAAYYAGKLEGTNGWFDELSKASGGTYTPALPTTGSGGTYGGYLFDENGLEYEQMIEKGLFGAVLYKQLSELFAGAVTANTVDKAIAIIGANPTFPSSNDATKHTQPDKFMATYVARRDKNDGNGFYSKLKYNFLKLQAAINAGDDYEQEKRDAMADIKSIIEKVNAATIINYCYAVTASLSATNPTDAQKASALHAYGECVGFAHGWRTLTDKKISDTQIDELLVLFNAPYNGTPTSYKFVTDAVNELPKLQQVINKLKDIYAFSAQDLEDFKKNWITEQVR